MTPIRRLALTALVALFIALGTAVPVSAATLTVTGIECATYSFPSYYTANYRCRAYVSGGTGTYVSYTWNVTSNRGNYTVVTAGNILERTCYTGNLEGRYSESFYVRVTVKDSAGATASRTSDLVRCGAPL